MQILATTIISMVKMLVRTQLAWRDPLPIRYKGGKVWCQAYKLLVLVECNLTVEVCGA